MRKLFSFLIVAMLCIVFSLSTTSNATKLNAGDYEDYQVNTYWSESMKWAINEGIITGFPDEKKIKPLEYLTEAQMSVIVLNFLNKSEVESIINTSTVGQHWSSPYYEVGQKYNLELSYSTIKKRDQQVRRGTVAKFLAQSLTGKKMSEQEAVQWMYDNEISNGFPDKNNNTPKTYESYHPNEKLSRAHAVIFIYNIHQHLQDKTLKIIEQKSNELSINGFELGDHQSKFEQLYGASRRILTNDDGLTIHTYYHNEYEDFLIAGFDENNEAAFLYTNQEIFTSRLNDISLKNRKLVDQHFNLKSLEPSTKVEVDEKIITFYYDALSKDSNIRAIQIQGSNWSFGKASKLDNINDYFIFDITNSYRIINGLNPLKWNGEVASTAYKHSKDMLTNKYFNHTNKQGQSPFDRLMAVGIQYSKASENIASNFSTGVDVIEAWMNSSHHRETILTPSYTHLGVGSYNTYYTQIFLHQ